MKPERASLSRARELGDGVLRRLHGAGANDLAGGLRLEDRRLLREGVDALARLRGGLLDDDELREARQQEDAVLLELLVTDVAKRLENALDVLLGQLVGVLFRQLLNQLGLGQYLGHAISSL